MNKMLYFFMYNKLGGNAFGKELKIVSKHIFKTNCILTFFVVYVY